MANRLSVLIVEDEALLSMDLEQIVLDAGHHVVGIAATAKQAIRLAQAHEPRLALVDLQLADGPSGPVISRELSAGGKTAVVFMTANSAMLPGDMAGAVGVIAKPYLMKDVVSALAYLEDALLRAPPVVRKPKCLELSRAYSQKWID